MGSVVYEYICPQKCDYSTESVMRIDESQSTRDELCLECTNCHSLIIFKRVPGAYKNITRRERID